MTNKKFWLGITGSVLVLLFSNCATMIHTEEANVQASSGTLPAQFPVKSGHTYTVQYSTVNGETRIITIGENLIVGLLVVYFGVCCL